MEGERSLSCHPHLVACTLACVEKERKALFVQSFVTILRHWPAISSASAGSSGGTGGSNERTVQMAILFLREMMQLCEVGPHFSGLDDESVVQFSSRMTEAISHPNMQVCVVFFKRRKKNTSPLSPPPRFSLTFYMLLAALLFSSLDTKDVS